MSALASVPAAHAAPIFQGLTTAAFWTSVPRIPLVVLQKWMPIEPAARQTTAFDIPGEAQYVTVEEETGQVWVRALEAAGYQNTSSNPSSFSFVANGVKMNFYGTRSDGTNTFSIRKAD